MEKEVKDKEIRLMKRVWDVYTDKKYQELLNELCELEKEREFCRHGFDHLLDTARLAYVFSLERGYRLDKSLIYTAALLHDIGRVMQYKDGTPHDDAGVIFAKEILSSYSFTKDEIDDICEAIGGHRSKSNISKRSLLAEVLKDADKLSRNCFMCKAADECNWTDDKKNNSIIW